MIDIDVIFYAQKISLRTYATQWTQLEKREGKWDTVRNCQWPSSRVKDPALLKLYRNSSACGRTHLLHKSAKGKDGSSWAVKLKVGHFIRDSPKVVAGSNGWLLASFYRSTGILLVMRSSNAEPMLYLQGRDGRKRSFRPLLTTRCCYQAMATTLFASLPFLHSLRKSSLRCNLPLVGRTSPLCTVCLVSKIPAARMIWLWAMTQTVFIWRRVFAVAWWWWWL